MNRKILQTAIAILFIATTALRAQTIWYVNDPNGSDSDLGTSWQNCFSSIQKALESASAGDEIWVSEGTYQPTKPADRTSTNPRDRAFVLKAGVKIYGGFPVSGYPTFAQRDWEAYPTILSGDIGTPNDSTDNCYRVVISVGNVGNACLDGFIITGGCADGTGIITINGMEVTKFYGGGMLTYESSPTISNVIFRRNSAKSWGGGIANNESSPTITNVTITGNTASSGGGGGMWNLNASPIMTNVAISGNKAKYDGGGMHGENSSPILTNVTISGNTANDNGGGMFNCETSLPILKNVTISGNTAKDGGGMYSNSDSKPELTDVIISGNTATDNGGGIYNVDISPVLTNVTISGNTASTGRGGGMYNDWSSPILTNVTISENIARLNGGGIYNETSSPELTNVILSGNTATILSGGGICNVLNSSPVLTNVCITGNKAVDGAGVYNNAASLPVLTNVTISGNMASKAGGGMFNNGSGFNTRPVLRNTIIWGNSSGVFEDNGRTTYSYCLVQGINSDTAGCIRSETVETSVFIRAISHTAAPTIAGNYRLREGSPALNVGSNTFYSSEQTPNLSHINTDLDGNPRVVGGVIDMGAFEGATPVTPIYVNRNASGANNGDSWADAFNSLQDALDVAGFGDQIWVANGTYTPSKPASDSLDGGSPVTERNNSFMLKPDVAIYGGFAGTESSLGQRQLPPFGTPSGSILSGDIGTPVNNADNCYHVVLSVGDIGSACLDGFTITGGNANNDDFSNILIINGERVYSCDGGGICNLSSSPTFANLTITGNGAYSSGGGMFNTLSLSKFTNIVISNNVAGTDGGGMFNAGSNPTIASFSMTNIIVSGNSADGFGGGIHCMSCSPTITNAVISGNWSSHRGGGIYNEDAYPIITNASICGNWANFDGGGMSNLNSGSIRLYNSILWGNSTGITNSGSSPFFYNCLIQDRTDTTHNCIDATTVEDDAPIFAGAVNHSNAPTIDGNYRLTAGSPCIDAGNNSYNTTIVDLDRNLRIHNGIIDLGAYEYGSTPAQGIVNTSHATPSTLIYPNPTQHTLYIQSAETVEHVSIYDISGRALMQVANPALSIDINSLATGIYLVKVRTAQGETVKKIVKQ